MDLRGSLEALSSLQGMGQQGQGGGMTLADIMRMASDAANQRSQQGELGFRQQQEDRVRQMQQGQLDLAGGRLDVAQGNLDVRRMGGQGQPQEVGEFTRADYIAMLKSVGVDLSGLKPTEVNKAIEIGYQHMLGIMQGGSELPSGVPQGSAAAPRNPQASSRFSRMGPVTWNTANTVFKGITDIGRAIQGRKPAESVLTGQMGSTPRPPQEMLTRKPRSR